MTLFVLDVASYQGNLRVEDVVRAGFGAVNLKVSHGVSLRSVHPDLAGWVTRARAAGLGLSTFHWLDASASGTAQAGYAHAQLVAYGLTEGTAHVVDCEADATWAILTDYVATMAGLLRRPIVIYSGDWWWTATSRNWPGADLSPALWAAPNAGYLAAYPGDDSLHWRADYGGWAELAVMQYAVAPLTFPDGTSGRIAVSKSAIRDPQVWAALTTERQAMTFAPKTLLDARTFIRGVLPEIAVVSMGIVGSVSHNAQGTSYHLGEDDLRSDAYSRTESARDRAGLSNAASALDFGWWQRTVNGKAHNLRTYSVWLVAQCKANTADTRDIREVIYSPDGKVVKRWDRLGIRSDGDLSHTGHTHHSYFRDAENRDKTALFRRYFAEIGLGDDMTFEADQVPVKYPSQNPTNPNWSGPNALGSARDLAQETRDLVRALRAELGLLKTALTQAITNADDGAAVIARIDAQAAMLSGLLASLDVSADVAEIRRLLTDAGGDADLTPVVARLDALPQVISARIADAQRAAADALGDPSP